MSCTVSLSMSSAPLDVKSLPIQGGWHWKLWVRPGGTVAAGGHVGVLARLHAAGAGVILAASPNQATWVANSEDAVSTSVTRHCPEQPQWTTWHPAKMLREPQSFQQIANNDNKMFLQYISRFLMHKSLIYLIQDWHGLLGQNTVATEQGTDNLHSSGKDK